MTAQISDSVRYRGLDYNLAGVSGEGLFDPLKHGITPSRISSACWRGYYCAYAVHDRLVLDELHIGLNKQDERLARSGSGPGLYGVLPRYDDRAECWAYTLVQMPIAFTGGLLIGRDFIRELYVHMGFHPSWKYSHVYELLLRDGQLLESFDRSQQAAEFRSHVAATDLKPGSSASKQEIADWIERTFSLDYDR